MGSSSQVPAVEAAVAAAAGTTGNAGAGVVFATTDGAMSGTGAVITSAMRSAAAAAAAAPRLLDGGNHLLDRTRPRPLVSTPQRLPRRGIVCLASSECEGRYRTYVFSYVAALLGGSVAYDAASQLDKALMITLLYCLNIACWAALALAEPNAPRVGQPPADLMTATFSTSATFSTLSSVASRFSFANGILGQPPLASPAPPLGPPHHEADLPTLLRLSARTKTAIAAAAGATIAIPTSLPTAIFALDFGKEGAAVLSSLLSAIGFTSSIIFFRTFPVLLARRGWFGVHTLLAILGAIAAVSMSSIMFADYAKFSRGYIISSSLQNETVVTLHACPRPSCGAFPMWRPGANRPWAVGSGLHPFWSLRAGTRVCHRCGHASLIECKVSPNS